MLLHLQGDENAGNITFIVDDTKSFPYLVTGTNELVWLNLKKE